AGVAAADHHHVLAAGEDRLHVAQRLLVHAPVLLRQEVHGEVDAGEFAPRDRQVAPLLGAARQHDPAGGLGPAGGRYVDADVAVVMERHAFGFHLRDAAEDDALLHLEVGNAVGQEPAGLGELLVDVDVVAGAAELLRAGEAGRAGAHDRDPLAGDVGRRLGLDPAVLPRPVDDHALDGLDG